MLTKSKHRIDGQFYPVQREEILKLRKLRIINNNAFVYFALKYENPFCNRPIEIQVAEFCLRWGLPESSLYKAIAALNEHQAVKIRNRSITIEWAESTENSLPHSQQALATRNGESIIRSENQLSDPRIDIYIDRARGLESLESLDPPLPPEGELDGGETSFNLESEAVPNYFSSLQDRSKQLEEAMNMGKGGFSAAGPQGKIFVNASGHQGNIDIEASGHEGSVEVEGSGHSGNIAPSAIGHSGDITARGTDHSGDVTNNFFSTDLDKVPRSLLEKAEDLGITFDNEVVAALKEYHQSQFMGALRAMESYSGEIKYPNKYLLKKLPKMPKENLGLVMPLVDSSWLEKKGDPMPDCVKKQIREYRESLNLKQA